jgi:hypothetical protein
MMPARTKLKWTSGGFAREWTVTQGATETDAAYCDRCATEFKQQLALYPRDPATYAQATMKWVSGGFVREWPVTQGSSETEAAFCDRCATEFKAQLIAFPRDP